MQKTDIPSFITNSGIFNDSELEKLSSIEQLPTDQEIDAFKYDSEIQELLNAFIGDESTRITHQLLKAKDYLQRDEVKKAWMLALL